MRSLRVKLVAAFLLTSVLGIGLSALFIRQFVVREFDEYVITQRRTNFVNEARTYYTSYGSWDGMDRWFRSRHNAGSPGGKPSAGPPDKGKPNDHANEPIMFAVVDPNGRVVVPFGPYRAEQMVGAAEWQQGEAIQIDGQTVGYILTPQRDGFRDTAETEYLARTDRALGLATLLVIIVAGALGIGLTRVMIRPLRELTLATQQIAGGNLHQQVPVRSRDEIGVLATQFNRMSADLARANQLRQQMTADIAHDLRTPLTVISGYLEAMRDEILLPTPARFGTLHAETQILLHLVEELHTLTLADAGDLALNRRPVAVAELLEHVAATYQHVAEQHSVTLVVQAAAHVPTISLDVEHMTRVLRNLISNALRYTPAGGRILLISRVVGNAVQLVVADSGSGIAPEHVANVFERFYRADSSRQQESGGSGLGLAIAKSIVECHSGTISVESVLDHGTTFTITLPLG